MGGPHSLFTGDFARPEKRTLFMGGVNSCGKTSILYYLKLRKSCTELNLIPTIGFNVESVPHDGVEVQIFECGGCNRAHKLFYPMYLEGTSGSAYVVDSSNKKDLDLVKEDLQLFLTTLPSPTSPVLLLVNKQDCESALTPREVLETLSLYDTSEGGLGLLLAGRAWKVQACSAKTGDGVQEGFDWLCHQVVQR